MVVGAYFALILWVAWTVGRKRQAGRAEFFLAGRNVGWFVVGVSIFASNIGSEHLVGLAGSAAVEGVPVAQFEILTAFALLLLGWLFAPFYLRSGVFTMPEFLEKRYSRGPRTYLAVISVVGYVLTKIAVTVAATGIYWNFAPTLAVPRNDRWGRTYEGYSKRPDLVAELGAELIEGMQGVVGRDFMAPGKVLATAKHYLGDGGTSGGVDQGNTEVGEEELVRVHAAGYRAALASGAQTVMVSFSSWNGRKMHSQSLSAHGSAEGPNGI